MITDHIQKTLKYSFPAKNMELGILSSWNGEVRPLPPISSSQQCAMCNAMCLPVHWPISAQLPLLQKKFPFLTHKFMTLTSPYHKILTSKVLCFILLFNYRLSDFISYFTLPLLWVGTLRSVPIGHLIEISQRRGKVSDFPPHCLCFTFMQVQLNTSLLLDGLPTYIAYLHWFLVVVGFLSLIHPIKSRTSIWRTSPHVL